MKNKECGEIKFNINDCVKVKLTEKGINILKENHDRINKLCGEKFGEFRISFDNDGYKKFQLHDLMNTFGSYCVMGGELPFETNIIFVIGEKEAERKELKDLMKEAVREVLEETGGL